MCVRGEKAERAGGGRGQDSARSLGSNGGCRLARCMLSLHLLPTFACISRKRSISNPFSVEERALHTRGKVSQMALRKVSQRYRTLILLGNSFSWTPQRLQRFAECFVQE